MYRLFRLKDNDPHTLFHGVNGSRRIVPDRWYKANEKKVRDGSIGTEYVSGFHVMPTVADCKEYIKRFKNKDNLYICRVYVGYSLREKVHSPSNVYLVRSMLVTASDWYNALSNSRDSYNVHD